MHIHIQQLQWQAWDGNGDLLCSPPTPLCTQTAVQAGGKWKIMLIDLTLNS